jgi:hypothetical protein
MKIRLYEHTETFSLNLEAETVKEAALLIRFALNATKQVKYTGCGAIGDEVNAQIMIGRRARPTGSVRPQ